MKTEPIGNFWKRLPKPIIGLSPMDGVTDPCFRRIMALHGAPDVIMTEFLSVDGICHAANKALLGLAYHESERPIIAQLYGPQPESFFHVAQLVCELGFDGLDINMGCPSKKVISLGSGASLIKDPTRAKAIVEAARKGIERWVSGAPLSICEVSPQIENWLNHKKDMHNKMTDSERKPIPVSVKTRIGFDQIVIKDWIQHLLTVSPAAISIHGRTLKQGYRGDANWEEIAEAVDIARGSATLILGNGDLTSLNDVVLRVHQTGVDGVLIGRASMGNPWIFRQKEIARGILKHIDTSGWKIENQWIKEKPIGLHTRFSVALQHARLFEAMHGKRFFNGMRKHLGSYIRGFGGARALRTKLVHTNNSEEVEHLIKAHLYDKSSVMRGDAADAARSKIDAQITA